MRPWWAMRRHPSKCLQLAAVAEVLLLLRLVAGAVALQLVAVAVALQLAVVNRRPEGPADAP